MSFGELSEEGTRACLSKINGLEEGASTEQAVASLGPISTRSSSANKQLCTNRINQGTLQVAGGVRVKKVLASRPSDEMGK